MAVYLALFSSSLAIIIFFSGHVSLQLCLHLYHPPGDSSSSALCPERGQGRAKQDVLSWAGYATLLGQRLEEHPFFTGSALPVQVGRHRRKPPKARYRVEGTHWDQDLERMFSQAGKVPWLPGWSVARMRPGAQGSCSRTLGFPPTLRDLKSPATVCLCDLVRKGMDVSV